MKLPNGVGSVIKLSGKRRKPYAAVVTTGWIQIYNDDGTPRGSPRQRRKYLGYYEKRKDALAALIKLSEHDLKQDEQSTIPQAKPAQTLKYVPTFAQLWDEVQGIKKERWSDSIHKAYRLQFGYAKSIHNKRVDEITYPMLQDLMNKRMKDGHSAYSLRLYKTFFTMTLGEAVKIGYIPSNPATYITYKETKEKKEKHALTSETIKRIYHSDAKSRTIVLILIYTGMRINELLNLKKKDIHDGYLIAGEKTEAGKNRMIPIHPFIKPLIDDFIEKPRRSDSTVSMWIADDAEIYGDRFSPHECRHTFITLATEYHVDPVAIKRIVGHAATGVTEKVYTHLDLDYLASEIQKIPAPDDLK